MAIEPVEESKAIQIAKSGQNVESNEKIEESVLSNIDKDQNSSAPRRRERLTKNFELINTFNEQSEENILSNNDQNEISPAPKQTNIPTEDLKSTAVHSNKDGDLNYFSEDERIMIGT